MADCIIDKHHTKQLTLFTISTCYKRLCYTSYTLL